MSWCKPRALVAVCKTSIVGDWGTAVHDHPYRYGRRFFHEEYSGISRGLVGWACSVSGAVGKGDGVGLSLSEREVLTVKVNWFCRESEGAGARSDAL